MAHDESTFNALDASRAWSDAFMVDPKNFHKEISPYFSTKSKMCIRDRVKHAAIGVCVKNVETGQVVYEHNPGMALRPASVIKLLSSALALKREGDSLTYTTRVFYTGRIENGALLGLSLIHIWM